MICESARFGIIEAHICGFGYLSCLGRALTADRRLQPGRLSHLRPETRVARKPNYEFHKRRKELDRKAEKEEKLRRRRE